MKPNASSSPDAISTLNMYSAREDRHYILDRRERAPQDAVAIGVPPMTTGLHGPILPLDTTGAPSHLAHKRKRMPVQSPLAPLEARMSLKNSMKRREEGSSAPEPRKSNLIRSRPRGDEVRLKLDVVRCGASRVEGNMELVITGKSCKLERGGAVDDAFSIRMDSVKQIKYSDGGYYFIKLYLHHRYVFAGSSSTDIIYTFPPSQVNQAIKALHMFRNGNISHLGTEDARRELVERHEIKRRITDATPVAGNPTHDDINDDIDEIASVGSGKGRDDVTSLGPIRPRKKLDTVHVGHESDIEIVPATNGFKRRRLSLEMAPERRSGRQRNPYPARPRTPSPSPRPPIAPLDLKPDFCFPPTGIGRVAVSNEDVKRLQHDVFLNDVLIDFYLKWIASELHRLQPARAAETHFFNTFFYQRLAQKKVGNRRESSGAAAAAYENVRKWVAKVDLFTKKYVVIPVNENMHWYVAIVCNLCNVRRRPVDLEMEQRVADLQLDGDKEEPLLLILDSLGLQHPQTFKTIKSFLCQEAREKRGMDLDRTDIKGQKLAVPTQDNFSDCGLYVLHYIEEFLCDPHKFLHMHDDAKERRRPGRLEALWQTGVVKFRRAGMRDLLDHLNRAPM